MNNPDIPYEPELQAAARSATVDVIVNRTDGTTDVYQVRRAEPLEPMDVAEVEGRLLTIRKFLRSSDNDRARSALRHLTNDVLRAVLEQNPLALEFAKMVLDADEALDAEGWAR